MARPRFIIANFMGIVIAALAIAPSASANAQSSLCNGDMVTFTPDRITLKDVELDVKLDISQVKDQPTKYTVSFLKAGSDAIQNHVDYNFVLYDAEDKEIFNAATATGQQATLHTAEGVVSFSPTLKADGFGTGNITVYGINFIPLNPYTASFPCIPVPEFPVSALAGIAAAMGGAIVMSRLYKLRI